MLPGGVIENIKLTIDGRDFDPANAGLQQIQGQALQLSLLRPKAGTQRRLYSGRHAGPFRWRLIRRIPPSSSRTSPWRPISHRHAHRPMNKIRARHNGSQLIGIAVGAIAIMAALWYLVVMAQDRQLVAIQKNSDKMNDTLRRAEVLVRGGNLIGQELTNRTEMLQKREADLAPVHGPTDWMIARVAAFISAAQRGERQVHQQRGDQRQGASCRIFPTNGRLFKSRASVITGNLENLLPILRTLFHIPGLRAWTSPPPASGRMTKSSPTLSTSSRPWCQRGRKQNDPFPNIRQKSPACRVGGAAGRDGPDRLPQARCTRRASEIRNDQRPPPAKPTAAAMLNTNLSLEFVSVFDDSLPRVNTRDPFYPDSTREVRAGPTGPTAPPPPQGGSLKLHSIAGSAKKPAGGDQQRYSGRRGRVGCQDYRRQSPCEDPGNRRGLCDPDGPGTNRPNALNPAERQLKPA